MEERKRKLPEEWQAYGELWNKLDVSSSTKIKYFVEKLGIDYTDAVRGKVSRFLFHLVWRGIATRRKGAKSIIYTKIQNYHPEKHKRKPAKVTTTAKEEYTSEELGNSILKIIENLHIKITTLAIENRALVEEKHGLEKICRKKSEQIIKLNNDISKGVKRFDLHKLQDVYNKLPEK